MRVIVPQPIEPLWELGKTIHANTLNCTSCVLSTKYMLLLMIIIETSWQKVCLSSLLRHPVGSHSRRTWDSHNIQVCDFFFFFPETGLQKPLRILEISKKSISAALIHMHGLEPASYMFCWESRSGSQLQAHPSSPTLGLMEAWGTECPTHPGD